MKFGKPKTSNFPHGADLGHWQTTSAGNSQINENQYDDYLRIENEYDL